jgi:hypothetical protein
MTNLGHVYVLKWDELNNLEKERKWIALVSQYFPVYFIITVQIVIFNNMNFWDL